MNRDLLEADTLTFISSLSVKERTKVIASEVRI
jgi:hypothetical protein